MKAAVWIVGVVGLLGLTGGALTADELPDDWRHWSRFREIRIDEGARREAPSSGSLVRVAIPEELFAQGRSDLADLRVIDDRGEIAGYAIFIPGTGPAAAWRATELSDVGFVPGEHTQVVVDTGDAGLLHNAVEVTLPRAEDEFFTWVEVAASEDRQTWRIVRARAPLYRFQSRGFGRAVGIGYARTRDRWLRLRLLEGAALVPVERIQVSERVEDEVSFTRLRRSLVRRLDSPEGESWWEPEGRMQAVPIGAAGVATDRAEFYRPIEISVSDDGKAWRQVGQGAIHRYAAEGSPGDSGGDNEPSDAGGYGATEEPRESLQVGVRDTAAPFWRVTIFDRGDPPIEDLAVTLLQNRRFVVFRSHTGRAYRLVYGNPRAEEPEYELERVVSREALAAAPLAELGDEKVNDAWVSSEPFTERHPLILWSALGLAVLVIAGLAVKTLRQAP